jgi:hypothetical protein
MANAVLEAAARGTFDVDQLRLAAQLAIALKYPAAVKSSTAAQRDRQEA